MNNNLNGNLDCDVILFRLTPSQWYGIARRARVCVCVYACMRANVYYPHALMRIPVIYNTRVAIYNQIFKIFEHCSVYITYIYV